GLASGVIAIGAGAGHACALKDGGVSCWGLNSYGQLGNNSTTSSSVPVAVSGLASGMSAISAGDLHTCALRDGGGWCWGFNSNGQLGNNSTTDSHVPVAVVFPAPVSVGGIAEQPDVARLPAQSSADTSGHGTVLEFGLAAVVSIVVAAGGWTVARRRRVS
ncbi:MAG: RCC1 domain-containing protein, partial [Dehalococcoidia bacterium]